LRSRYDRVHSGYVQILNGHRVSPLGGQLQGSAASKLVTAQAARFLALVPTIVINAQRVGADASPLNIWSGSGNGNTACDDATQNRFQITLKRLQDKFRIATVIPVPSLVGLKQRSGGSAEPHQAYRRGSVWADKMAPPSPCRKTYDRKNIRTPGAREQRPRDGCH
jgi:hypothetical protein